MPVGGAPPTSSPAAGRSSPTRSSSRTRRLLGAGVAITVFAVAVSTMNPYPVGVFQDDGIYVILAKSLATGHGYRYLNVPGEPVGTHYPPGYPALLALLWRVSPRFPDNVALFKLANTFFLAATAAGAYWLGVRRLRLPPIASAATALLGCLSIPVLSLAGMVLSETFFLALLFPVLLLAERIASRARESRSRRARRAKWLNDVDALALLAGATCGALALVRTVGAPLALALALVLVWRRRPVAAALAIAGCIAVLLPWQLYIAAQPTALAPPLEGTYGSYGGWLVNGYRDGGFSFGVAVAVRNLTTIGEVLRILFAANAPTVVRLIAIVALTVVVPVGAWRMAHRAPVTAGFLALYFAIVIMWPFGPTRFLTALWPLVALVVASGMLAIWRWSPPAQLRSTPLRMVRHGGVALSAVLALGYVVGSVEGFRRHWWDSLGRRVSEHTIPLTEWVALNTRPGDRIVTDGETTVYLYTGRQAVPGSTFTAAEYVVPQSEAQALAALRVIVRAYQPSYVLAQNDLTAVGASRLTRLQLPWLRAIAVLPNGGAVFVPDLSVR